MQKQASTEGCDACRSRLLLTHARRLLLKHPSSMQACTCIRSRRILQACLHPSSLLLLHPSRTHACTCRMQACTHALLERCKYMLASLQSLRDASTHLQDASLQDARMHKCKRACLHPSRLLRVCMLASFKAPSRLQCKPHGFKHALVQASTMIRSNN